MSMWVKRELVEHVGQLALVVASTLSGAKL
jgi:hypothetical protein